MLGNAKRNVKQIKYEWISMGIHGDPWTSMDYPLEAHGAPGIAHAYSLATHRWAMDVHG